MLILWILLGSALLYFIQRSIYESRWDRKLRLDFRFTENAVTEGASAGLLERSENRKWLPLPSFGYRYVVKRNFITGADGDGSMTLKRKLALPGRRAVVNRARLDGLTRGVYSISELTVYASDLFHTLQLEQPMAAGSGLTVYPAKIPAQRLALPVRLLLGSVSTRRVAQEDPFALKAIRPYEIYDSPRIINWKASARTGELKVNQYDHSTDEALLFLLDLGSGPEADREELIRLASSLSQLFLRRGVSVALLANGRSCSSGLPIRVGAGGDPSHQIAVDEALARINLSAPATQPYGEFLAGVGRDALRGALPLGLSADPTGAAFGAFQRTPGVRGGYFLSVNGRGGPRTEGGVTLLNWNASEGEVTL